MKLIRYEYPITDEINGTYYGSFTLKANSDKQIVKKLKAKEIEKFTICE